MPSNYDLLRRYARGIGREQVESPAAGLEFYAMVSSVWYKCSLLIVEKLRAISLEQDRVEGDVMRWQYGAAEALHYVCVLHAGDEGVARVVVVARYVLWLFCQGGSRGSWGADGGHAVAAVP